MFKKQIVFMLIFLSITTSAIAQIDTKIEIFDVQQEKVVATGEVTSGIRRDVEGFLKGITGVYKKLNPVPTTGFMVKVPLMPNVTVENEFFKGEIVEVIVVFSLQEDPYLMAFDDNNQFYVFTFEGDTDSFLEKLNYNPRTSY